MKKVTKRIILSIVSLAFIAVALGTTTFAWFTLSNVATVSDIEGTVQAGEGIEIALGVNGTEVTNYKTNLTSTDWQLVMDKIAENNSNTKFEFGPATTTDGFNFYNLEVDGLSGTNTVLKQSTTALTENVAGSYLEFDIFFKSNSAATINWEDYEFLEGLSNEFTPGVPFTNGRGVLVNANDTVNFDASNAARIAMYNADGTTLIKSVQKAAGAGTSADDNTVTNAPQFNGQYSYLKAKGYSIDEVTDDGTTLTEAPDILEAGTKDTFESTELLTLGGDDAIGYSGSIKVRVWLEGWDADMYDALFRSSLKFNLVFNKQ